MPIYFGGTERTSPIYRFYPDEQTINGKTRSLMIQADGESCSRFALQQLFSLAKNDDVHIQLRNNQANLRKEEIFPGKLKNCEHYAISFSNCPDEIASAFQSTQSLSAFSALNASTKNQIVNMKGETLEQFHQRHTRANPTANNKIQNMGIMDFKESRSQSTEEFLDSINSKQLDRLLSSNQRTGVTFLTEGQQHRDTIKNEQFSRINPKKVEKINQKNLVLQQLNALCRVEIEALNEILKVTNDAKNKTEIASLQNRVEKLRVEIMEVKLGKTQSIQSVYQPYLIKLRNLDMEIRKQQFVLHNKIDIQKSKSIDSALLKLSDLIQPKATRRSKLNINFGQMFKPANDKQFPKTEDNKIFFKLKK